MEVVKITAVAGGLAAACGLAGRPDGYTRGFHHSIWEDRGTTRVVTTEIEILHFYRSQYFSARRFL